MTLREKKEKNMIMCLSPSHFACAAGLKRVLAAFL